MSNKRWLLQNSSIYTSPTGVGRIATLSKGDAVSYLQQKSQGYAYVRYEENGITGWIYANHLTATNPYYNYPTDSLRMSRGYIPSVNHFAFDIVDDEGSPIYAICDGTVSFVQEHNTNYSLDANVSNSLLTMGNSIAINHYNPDQSIHNGDYLRTMYMHLQYAPTLSVGDDVSKGQIIGYMGNTGRSSGTHLHFALAVGNSNNLKPGSTTWVVPSQFENSQEIESYFPDYYVV